MNVTSLSLHGYTVHKRSVSYMKFFISVVFKMSPVEPWGFQRDFWGIGKHFSLK